MSHKELIGTIGMGATNRPLTDLEKEQVKTAIQAQDAGTPVLRAFPKNRIRRSKKARGEDVQNVLLAIDSYMTPAKIHELLKAAEEIALRQRTAAGVMELLRFCIEYQIGKPVRRQISASVDLEQFHALFAPDDDEGFDIDYQEDGNDD